jgi:hypothetical protein
MVAKNLGLLALEQEKIKLEINVCKAWWQL